jgi:hypothetical protein
LIESEPINDDFDAVRGDLDAHLTTIQLICEKLGDVEEDADVNLTADATINLINTTGTGQIDVARLDVGSTISAAITTSIETHRTTTTDGSMHPETSIQSSKLGYTFTPTSLVTSPANLLDEIKNIRVMLDRVIGTTYWTDTPAKTLAQLSALFNEAGQVLPESHASSHITGGTDVIPNAVAGGNAGLMTGVQVTKLNGIEEYATADQSASEIRALVSSATDSNVFTDAYKTKVDGIETNATADQTAAEIRALVTSATDSNVFTDGYKSKVDGIENNANAYVHPTTDGSKHIPANGIYNEGKVLTASATAGVYTWESKGLPSGAIIMWGGAILDIPTDWYICDGTNGTPDLRGRFVLGAGGAYSVDDVGGEEEHTLTIDEMPAHTHSQWGVNRSQEFETSQGLSAAQNSSSNTGSTGGDQPHNNMPPYYAMAYIMYLP